MGKVKPLSPSEVRNRQCGGIPDCIIEAVNELLVKEWTGTAITISQPSIIKLAIKKNRGKGSPITGNMMIDNGWLNFEPIYRKLGWNVYYEKPDFNEPGEPYFTFKPK